jgi:hypothetical protein
MQEPAPQFLTNILPDALRDYALLIVVGGACIVGIVVLLLLYALVRLLFRGKAKPVSAEPSLAENLAEYPDLKKTSGDRQLRAEGVPVRLRLVVVAPAGTGSDIDIDDLEETLEKILPGLGEIYKNDKPRVKIWPTQVSYQGFANHFHKNTHTGGGEGELTRWALVAGRVRLGKQQLMLGVALQSIKPNTIGRRTVDSHEWASILRVRVKE